MADIFHLLYYERKLNTLANDTIEIMLADMTQDVAIAGLSLSAARLTADDEGVEELWARFRAEEAAAGRAFGSRTYYAVRLNLAGDCVVGVLAPGAEGKPGSASFRDGKTVWTMPAGGYISASFSGDTPEQLRTVRAAEARKAAARWAADNGAACDLSYCVEIYPRASAEARPSMRLMIPIVRN